MIKQSKVEEQRSKFIDAIELVGSIFGALEYGLSEESLHPDDKDAKELWSKMTFKFEELKDLAIEFDAKFGEK